MEKEIEKDVIYLDVDDDITSVIEKVKKSKKNIIALVPPNNQNNSLSSSISLRLLKKTAGDNNKKLFIVTNSSRLRDLAAIAGIKVAKNLQAEPEAAEIPALKLNDNDVIDGTELSDTDLGQFASESGRNKSRNINSDTLNSIKLNDSPEPIDDKHNYQQPTSFSESRKNKKIPNINNFRKKLIISLILIIAIVGGLIWALVFAPAATIIIKAKTSDVQIAEQTTLSTTSKTSYGSSTLKTDIQMISKDESISFSATGTEDKGNKATGTMTLINSNTSSSVYVPASTEFSSGNYIFMTTSAITVPGVTVSNGSIISSNASVNVAAENVGDDYNLSARNYTSSLSGITAAGSQMTGGSKQTVKIVTGSDVQTAETTLTNENTDSIKKQLKSQFSNGEVILDNSFNVNRSDPQVSPVIGGESSDGKATLKVKSTYTMLGINQDELDAYLTDCLNDKLEDQTKQRVYNSGVNKVQFADFAENSSNNGGTANIKTTGKVGPKIDENQIKEQSKGKKFGDVQSNLEKINGVDSVSVKFSYFWVNTIPNDVSKIKIEFSVNNND